MDAVVVSFLLLFFGASFLAFCSYFFDQDNTIRGIVIFLFVFWFGAVLFVIGCLDTLGDLAFLRTGQGYVYKMVDVYESFNPHDQYVILLLRDQDGEEDYYRVDPKRFSQGFDEALTIFSRETCFSFVPYDRIERSGKLMVVQVMCGKNLVTQ